MRCIMGMRIIIHHSKHFPMQSKSICTITTTNGFRRKQNGCRLRYIGKHPCVQLKHDTNVSRILGTYHPLYEGVFVYRPLQKGDIMELFAPGKKLLKNVNLQKVGISTYQNLTFCIGKNFNANPAKKRSKEV